MSSGMSTEGGSSNGVSSATTNNVLIFDIPATACMIQGAESCHGSTPLQTALNIAERVVQKDMNTEHLLKYHKVMYAKVGRVSRQLIMSSLALETKMT